MLPRFRVLGHKEHVAPLLPANFVHECREVGRICQIDICVRFHTVAISTAYQQHVPLASQAPHRAVLFPVAQSVQFQCVQPRTVFL